MTKKQTKTPPAKRTAKQTKGKAKRTPPPVQVRDIGRNCPPVLEPAMRAIRGRFQEAVDASRPLRPAVSAEAVAPWRDWARRLCERCGRDWDRFEREEADMKAGKPSGGAEMWCGMFYRAAQEAFRDYPPAVADKALRELLEEVGKAWDARLPARLSGRDDTEAVRVLCNAVLALPRTLRRIAESPSLATPPPPAPANAATPTDADGKAKRTRGRGGNLPADVKQAVLDWLDRERGGDVRGEGWRDAFDAFSASPDCSARIRQYVGSPRAFKRVAEAARKARARRLKRMRGQKK